MENKYLEEVLAAQQNVQDKLMKKRAPEIQALDAPARRTRTLAEASAPVAAPAVDVRVTGFWRFQTVIVPPNAYVVHTRRGRKEPVDIGLGISFRFNPQTDAYLVVPATTQTILISAPCICRERQGILVQGYVQWIIEDFAKAYKKLDFSDPVEPMRIVNTQLKEQAEATIKDTVATLSIDGVLSDKQPIIKELTRRLREVTEGDGKQEGLGLGIVTVQIKEAVVSSARLWESLQRPFRAERAKDARLAELENDGLVKAREAEAQKQAARLEIETRMEAQALRAKAEADAFDREQTEKVRRVKLEAEGQAEVIAAQKAKLAQEAELARLELEASLQIDERQSQAKALLAAREIDLEGKRQAIANDLSSAWLQAKLIAELPAIMERLPKANEQKNVTITSQDNLGALIGGLMQVVERVKA